MRLILVAIVIVAFYLIWCLGQGPILSDPRTVPKRILAFVLGAILIGRAIFFASYSGGKAFIQPGVLDSGRWFDRLLYV